MRGKHLSKLFTKRTVRSNFYAPPERTFLPATREPHRRCQLVHANPERCWSEVASFLSTASRDVIRKIEGTMYRPAAELADR